MRRTAESSPPSNTLRLVNGGLVVTEPETQSLARTAALLLDFQKVTGAELAGARLVVETSTAAMAAKSIDEALMAMLHDEIRREAEQLERGETAELIGHEAHGLHLLIANASGNNPLALFVDVLIQLTHSEHGRTVMNSQVRTKAARMKMATDIHRAHCAIVEAVVSGDAALAQHRAPASRH